ncbi:MAG: HEAT repeat domain-containing protein [Sedimentisphaerales bacterium]|nr:HEAT repeat domain-containing protein [Sedimentisphaerales bacterium]
MLLMLKSGTNKGKVNNMWSIKSLKKTLFWVALSLVAVCGHIRGQDTQNKQGPLDDPTRQAAKEVSHQDVDQRTYPVTLFYSSGDAIVEYSWMPMDSEATCKAAFDILRNRYNCDRILWREADNDWVVKWGGIRKDSPWLGDLMTDALRINRQYKNTEHAGNAAQANGIQFWGTTALYDYGGKAECGAGGSRGMGSFWGYDPWLLEHPEYCLWDRAHITYMTGIIEYGNPEVRKEYVRRVEEMFKGPWSRYEGMFMYSFIENTEAHYTDEYIYSDIAVQDFKKRYGVDVRTQPFDIEKYYAMRGEYITQYLRELRPVYQKYHKKLAIALNSENMEWPQLWLSGASIWPKNASELFILQQGRVKMDWRTWVAEGLVDELHVWGGTSPDKKIEDVKELIDATKGTGVKITVFFRGDFPESEQSLYTEGVRRVISTDSDNEEGGKQKHLVSDIDSQDSDAVLNVLTQARKKEVDVPLEKITALLLKHPNPLVRRQAANTIGTLKLQGGVWALDEAAINDLEGSVKAMVFDALGKVNGPNSVEAMARGFGKVNTFPARMALRNSLAAMGPERYADVAKAYDTRDSYFRTVLLQSFTRRNGTPEYLAVVKRAIEDPNEKVRWWAAFAFAYNSPRQENMEILCKALDDSCGAVQSRAAMTLVGMVPKMTEEMKQRIFDKLIAKYQEFGAGCKRTDCDWGWRPIGETIRDGFEVQGKTALLDILNGKNTELAKLTWRVFFQPNDDQWHPIAKEDMARKYRFYPGRPDHQKCPSTVLD